MKGLNKAAGFFKYVRPFSGHQALKGKMPSGTVAVLWTTIHAWFTIEKKSPVAPGNKSLKSARWEWRFLARSPHWVFRVISTVTNFQGHMRHVLLIYER